MNKLLESNFIIPAIRICHGSHKFVYTEPIQIKHTYMYKRNINLNNAK